MGIFINGIGTCLKALNNFDIPILQIETTPFPSINMNFLYVLIVQLWNMIHLGECSQLRSCMISLMPYAYVGLHRKPYTFYIKFNFTNNYLEK